MAEIIYNLPGFVTLPSIVYDGNATLTQIAANRLIFPDKTTPIVFVGQINNNDLNILLSALLSGVQMQQPSETERVYENIVEWFEMPIDLCQLIAQCIRDDPSTRDAIRELIIDEPAEGGTPTTNGGNPSALAQELVNNCNFNNFFAACTGVIDLLNNIITDIFERIEISTTSLERTSIIIEAIPVIGQLPADDILEFADNELENLAQGYDAAYTVQLRDEYRCDLFCLYRDDCALNFAELADYFASRAQTDFSNLTWNEAFAYFLTGASQGETISHAAHYLVCLALAYGSRAIGFSAADVASITRALSNDSDADWELLCDCVEAPCYQWNFDAGNGGWQRTQGAYVSAGYWRTAGNVANDDTILKDFRVTLPQTRTLSRVEVDYEVTSRGTGETYIRWINNADDSIIDGQLPVQGGQQTYFSPTVTISGANVLEFDIRAGDRSSVDPNQIRVYAVRLYCSD